MCYYLFFYVTKHSQSNQSIKAFKHKCSKNYKMIYSCFQIKLCDVEEVELLDRRGYLVISVTLTSRGEGKIYLRKTEGIRDWFNSLKVSLLYVLTVYSLSK